MKTKNLDNSFVTNFNPHGNEKLKFLLCLSGGEFLCQSSNKFVDLCKDINKIELAMIQPMEINLIKGGKCFAFYFYSNKTELELKSIYGDNFYKEGELPNKNWDDSKIKLNG